MTTPQHESVATMIPHFISIGLDKIEAQSHHSPDTIKLVQSIGPLGTAGIRGEDRQYQPDAQYQLRDHLMTEYPGLAIEVSWSQSWAGKEGLEKKMGKLLEDGNGVTQTVIGVRLTESASGDLKMWLCLWRYAIPSDRVWDCVPILPDDKRSLRLTLGDFISKDVHVKYFPGADLDAEMMIPLGRVYKDARCRFELWKTRQERDKA